jgi:hypothetical protein
MSDIENRMLKGRRLSYGIWSCLLVSGGGDIGSGLVVWSWKKSIEFTLSFFKKQLQNANGHTIV